MNFAAILLVAAAAMTPRSAVAHFYTEYLKQPVGGLPSGAQLEALRPMLSRSLHRSVVRALEYQEAWSRKHPDEKPPFVDGDHFTSVFEGAKSFDIVRVAGERVRVRFHAPGATDWEDVVVVKKEGGRYVIDDVIFGGAGAFNPKGRLSQRLRAREE